MRSSGHQSRRITARNDETQWGLGGSAARPRVRPHYGGGSPRPPLEHCFAFLPPQAWNPKPAAGPARRWGCRDLGRCQRADARDAGAPADGDHRHRLRPLCPSRRRRPSSPPAVPEPGAPASGDERVVDDLDQFFAALRQVVHDARAHVARRRLSARRRSGPTTHVTGRMPHESATSAGEDVLAPTPVPQSIDHARGSRRRPSSLRRTKSSSRRCKPIVTSGASAPSSGGNGRWAPTCWSRRSMRTCPTCRSTSKTCVSRSACSATRACTAGAAGRAPGSGPRLGRARYRPRSGSRPSGVVGEPRQRTGQRSLGTPTRLPRLRPARARRRWCQQGPNPSRCAASSNHSCASDGAALAIGRFGVRRIWASSVLEWLLNGYWGQSAGTRLSVVSAARSRSQRGPGRARRCIAVARKRA